MNASKPYPAWLSSATYDDARSAYHSGLIDDTDWALYQFYWRNGCYRWSSVAIAFDIHPDAWTDYVENL
jgi:hypothetical protein